MHEYEIRILRTNNNTDTIVEGRYWNDDAAIRAARKLAEVRPFEVWRGLDCIYGLSHMAALAANHAKPPS